MKDIECKKYYKECLYNDTYCCTSRFVQNHKVFSYSYNSWFPVNLIAPEQNPDVNKNNTGKRDDKDLPNVLIYLGKRFGCTCTRKYVPSSTNWSTCVIRNVFCASLTVFPLIEALFFSTDGAVTSLNTLICSGVAVGGGRGHTSA